MGSSEVLGSFKSTSTSHKTNKNKKTWILIRIIINGYCWNENRMLIHSLYATLTTAQQSFYPPSVIDSGLGLGNDVCCRHIWGKVRTRVETDFSPASVYWFKVLDGEREREREREREHEKDNLIAVLSSSVLNESITTSWKTPSQRNWVKSSVQRITRSAACMLFLPAY